MLAASHLVAIGAHTRTHPRLADLPEPCQWDEIVGGKNDLQQLLGSPVDLFSYLFGGGADYTNRTTAIVRDSGYAAACSNFAAAITAETDPFQVPRLFVEDWPVEEFERRLETVAGDRQ